jgi:hypothetical protein
MHNDNLDNALSLLTIIVITTWVTASERHVDEQRAAQGLSRLINDVAPGDESADKDMDPKSPPRPSGSA